jgi:hypothetical protein
MKSLRSRFSMIILHAGRRATYSFKFIPCGNRIIIKGAIDLVPLVDPLNIPECVANNMNVTCLLLSEHRVLAQRSVPINYCIFIFRNSCQTLELFSDEQRWVLQVFVLGDCSIMMGDDEVKGFGILCTSLEGLQEGGVERC